MNDLYEAYGYYSSADSLLKMLNGRKNGSLRRTSLKKTSHSKTIVQLLMAYEFISITGEGKKQEMTITEKGKKHVLEGGFEKILYLEPIEQHSKTFKQHLDDLTGLLTIFGILNAITIFASQFKNSDSSTFYSLNITGTQFISISMYSLSLVVLWEIIWTTVKEGQRSFKFQALYILLCMTTVGIGLLFINQFKELLYGVVILLTFFGLFALLMNVFIKLFGHIITAKNGIWFRKHVSKVTFVLMLISMILSSIILKQILSLIFSLFHFTLSVSDK